MNRSQLNKEIMNTQKRIEDVKVRIDKLKEKCLGYQYASEKDAAELNKLYEELDTLEGELADIEQEELDSGLFKAPGFDN